MTSSKPNPTEGRVLELVQAFLTESGNEHGIAVLSLDASLEEDLGIDSIGRAEILRKLEKAFEITVSDQTLVQVETVKDLVQVVHSAKPEIELKETVSISKRAGLSHVKEAKTIPQVMAYYMKNDRDRTHIYLQSEEAEATPITYGMIDETARRVAQGLIDLGIGRGDTVAIMLPTCQEFFYAFIGILYAGAIPVPIYPPYRPDEIEKYAKYEAKVLNNAEARALITFERGKAVAKIIKNFIPSLKKICTVDSLKKADRLDTVLAVYPDDPALIQYTSGSTGDPKGVLLLHRNILANLNAIAEKMQLNEKDVIVSWLPLYHDMGLIGSWLGSLYFGIPLVLHSPITFLMHPEKWLWSIHRYKGTISASPNFGYELCNNKIHESDLEGLDLSSWRLALNGAESVYSKTMRNFIHKFQAYHFDPTAMFPAYGLAESTVALALPDLGCGLQIEKINREKFENNQDAERVSDVHTDYFEFVACGKALPHHNIRIINDDGQLLGERMVGHIQFQGPSTMQGYYHNPEATKNAFNDGWCDTGDLGYLADGVLFPTGRQKDIILKAGRNIYPEDIERTVSAMPSVRKGGVVAFGIEEEGTERIVVIVEVRDKLFKQKMVFIPDVIKKVKEAIGIPPDKVHLVAPKTIPKTSSGKLRRSAAKTLYLNNELEIKAAPVWLQLSKLFMESTGRVMYKGLQFILRCFYGAYVSLLLLLTFMPLWLSLFVLSRKHNATLAKVWAKSFLFLIGCPLKKVGSAQLKKDQHYIFVANHTSFVDSLALLASLPAGVLFLAKKELTTVPFLRSFIKRLGHLTVTREDFKLGIKEVERVSEVLEQHQSLVIYPEGTFTYARGIRHFKLGAFNMAIDNETPICPVALKGTRDILRASELLPRPGKIHLTIGEPIDPSQKEWKVSTLIRDKTRRFIAEESGEELL